MDQDKNVKLEELKGFKRFLKAFKYVFPYYRPYKNYLAFVGFLAVLATIFEPSFAFSMKPFIHYIFIEKNTAVASMVPFILVFLFLIREGGNFFYEYHREKLSLSVVRDLQCALYDHFTNLSMDHYDRMSTGEMMSRTVRDVALMQNTMPLAIDFVKHLIKLFFLLTVCVLMQPLLTLIAFGLILFTIRPVATIGYRMRTYTKRGLKEIASINVHMQETYSGAKIVKAYSQEEKEVRRYRQNQQSLLKVQLKYAKAKYLQGPVTNIISIMGVAVVIGIAVKWATQIVPTKLDAGWWFFLAGVPVNFTTEYLPKVNQANFWAFLGALGLTIVPIRDLARVQGSIQTVYGAVERVVEALERKASVKEDKKAIDIPQLEGEIRYENVHFKYENQWVLKNFNLVVKKGELVALVGPSGAGKTTVVNLLPRFYEVAQGRILIDGVDIQKATFKSLRGQIGIVTQETFLFNDTVENNIKYGSPEKSREEIIESAKAANAHDFIIRLPQGYDTIIGERGIRLSGGERQRIAIARALVKNPPVLLLDEATSSLDTEAEREVQRALDNLMKNRTTIAIAHRLSTVRNADRIIVLSDGEIVEQGTHQELIARSGLYRKLYELQFAEEPIASAQNPDRAEEK